MSTLVYLIGPPAAGKSTLMQMLTGGCDRAPSLTPFPHDILIDPATALPVGAEMGRRRAGFPGTDTLAMNVSPIVCRWLAEGGGPGLLLGEGDRLAHLAVFTAATQGGRRVVLGHVSAPQRVLDARCAGRGSSQAESWRAGRATKVDRLTAAAAEHHTVLTLDSVVHTPAELVVLLRAAVPELEVLPVVAR